METIIIWAGSGFALGIGVFLGMCLMRIAAHDKTDLESQFHRMNRLMEDRDAVGFRQAAALERIVSLLEHRKD